MSNAKYKGNKKNRRYWFIVCFIYFTCLFPCSVYSQIIPDVATIEAYINDHKKQRSLLLARSVLEESNKQLHELSANTNRQYRDINIELDKYARAFDTIDLIFDAVSTGFNVYHTYDNVKDKLGKYKTMLQRYNEVIIKRGKIESADTLLLRVNERAIQNITHECENIYKSLIFIAAYASKKIPCSTYSLMFMVECIDNSLNRITDIVNQAYFRTWQYIQVRTSFWKASLFRSKPIKQIVTDAIGRWLESGGILGY